MVIEKIGSKNTSFAKIWAGLACLVALCGLTGCSGKGGSDAKTPQEIQDFRGHQPTSEQLEAAMARTRPQPAPAPGQPATAKP